MIDPRIFRAYDIRGKAMSQLSEEACWLIGQAFGMELRRMYGINHPQVLLGRDMRLSSSALEEATLKGLMDAGCHVLTMGQTPSPLNYFTVCRLRLDGSIQITASHNPKDDNGLKLQVREAEAFAGEDIQRLRETLEEDKGPWTTDKGSVKEVDAIGPYVDHLTKLFGGVGKGLRVAIDYGNGVTGPVYGEVFRKIGCDAFELFKEPDGTFPHHPADPSKRETLKNLQEAVQKEKTDIGFAFDGDGDRVGVVDETGVIRSADDILLLLAEDHLGRNPGVPIVFTVSNSSVLEEEITKWGGRPIMTKVGHSFVEHAMRRQGSLLGGEQSGHFFCFEDYYGFDDALVAALRVIKILNDQTSRRTPLRLRAPQSDRFFDSNSCQTEEAQPAGGPSRSLTGRMTLSSLMSAFPKVYLAPERRPHCPDDAKGKIIRSVIAHFSKSYPVNTLDGARIDFGDGAWAGIRQSNTSPCLSICIEARSPEKLKEIEEIVLTHLKSYRTLEL